MTDFPSIALSVRQPWASAIIHGGKDVENRTKLAITKGGMAEPQRIAIHASKGMTQDEYEHARSFIESIGKTCPRPDELPRGAIIGSVNVTGIVQNSESDWFFGPWALTLANPEPCWPIACNGQLGYFRWQEKAGGTLAEPAVWMRKWGEDRPQLFPEAKTQNGDLFQ